MNVLPRRGVPFALAVIPPHLFVGHAAELAAFGSLLDDLLKEKDQPPVLVLEGRHGLGRSAFLRRARTIALGRQFDVEPRVSQTSWSWQLRDVAAGWAVILVDDAEGLSDKELAGVASLLADTKEQRLLLVLAGLPGTARRLQAAGLRHALTSLPLVPVTETEASRLLQKAASDFGEIFAPEALREVVQQAAGIPALLQIRGEVLWGTAPNSPISLLDIQDAEKACVQRTVETFLAPPLARATRSERRYLVAAAALADDNDTFSSGELEARLLAGRASRIDGGLRRALLAKGLLYAPTRGALAFAHPGLAAYVRASETVAP